MRLLWLFATLFLVSLLTPRLLDYATTLAAQREEQIVLLPLTSEAYGITSVVPEGWQEAAPGIHARQRDADDPALIAQQSALASPDDVLTSLLPQLGLVEAPQSVGTFRGSALNWTLYQIDVPFDTITIRVDLALANEGGTTYLVLLQASSDEFDALHEGVFLPTLEAFAPLVLDEAPVPYIVEEVTFPSGDHTLAGTLTLPPEPGPHPAIVLVSGSGPQDRDETLGAGIAIKPFRLLADALTRAGVAVLRYDDRGVGESTGTFSTASTTDLADDAAAAIDYLLTREEIDPDQIGLLGHSEGGIVAAMLGARNDDLDFIISLAGTGVSGRDVLLLQNRRLMEAEGASQEEIEAQVAFVEDLIANIDDPEKVEQLVYERALVQIAALPEEERSRITDPEVYARTVAKQSAQQYNPAWFKPFLTYDPAVDWAQTTVPVLALFGGKDVQVDAAQNAAPMLEALQKAGNEDVAVVILPNANHLFQEATTGAFSEYATLPPEFTPDLLPTLLTWLDTHLRTADEPATPVAATPVSGG